METKQMQTSDRAFTNSWLFIVIVGIHIKLFLPGSFMIAVWIFYTPGKCHIHGVLKYIKYLNFFSVQVKPISSTNFPSLEYQNSSKYAL